MLQQLLLRCSGGPHSSSGGGTHSSSGGTHRSTSSRQPQLRLPPKQHGGNSNNSSFNSCNSNSNNSSFNSSFNSCISNSKLQQQQLLLRMLLSS